MSLSAPLPPVHVVAGPVLTMDPARPRAEAFAVADGTVVAVGGREQALAACPPGTPVVEPAARAIVPGLIDAHLHLQWTGLKLLRLLGDRPFAVDEALEALDGDAFGDPWPGPPPTLEQRLAGLRLAQPLLHRLGLTGVVDPAATAAELAAYQECHRRGELTIRVTAMPHPDLSDGAAAAIERLSGLGVRTGFGDERLRLGGIKVYFDGVGMAGTALRREPWPGDPDGSRGWQRIDDEELALIAGFCARERWSLGVHVVGGGGIDAVLGAFAAADRRWPIGDLRFSLIHAYLEPSPQNMRLARELGVVVAAQPSIQWVNGPGLVTRLGPAAAASNPLRAWHDAGVAVAGGSDGPDFPLDPRLGLWQARTRRVRDAPEPLGPEQALTAAEALRMYTSGAAHACFGERRQGTIRPGAAADWTALSVDPLRAPAADLRQATAIATVVAGMLVATGQAPAPAAPTTTDHRDRAIR